MMVGKHLRALFELTHWTMKTNLQGVSHRESLVTPVPGGNCINWVLGHILVSRKQMLAILGHELEWGGEACSRYARGTPPLEPGEAVEPLERLLEILEATQAVLLELLGEETPTAGESGEEGPSASGRDPDTRTPADDGAEADEEELVAEISRFNFHESYHAGQIGLLRRIVGKEGAIP